LEGKAALAREKAKIGSLDGGCRRSASHSIAAECGALNRRDATRSTVLAQGLSSDCQCHCLAGLIESIQC
jgi:hypothetical protein